jgi:KipI family sensor histidine kinase inhibitor
VLVELGSRVDTALNFRCRSLATALKQRRDVRDAVAGYASVTVHYDPEQLTHRGLVGVITRLLQKRPPPAPPGRLHRIPVSYDGPDLAWVAEATGLSLDQVVAMHTHPIYRVFTLGFVPGFAYLGPLPPRLQLPRRAAPRTRVPAGSVAIAGHQTGIYPLESPGGWHLIGRTTMRLFLPEYDPPVLLRPGDRVKFFPT